MCINISPTLTNWVPAWLDQLANMVGTQQPKHKGRLAPDSALLPYKKSSWVDEQSRETSLHGILSRVRVSIVYK